MSWIKRLIGDSRTTPASNAPPDEASTESVVKLAKVFLAHLRQKAPDFERAFYRAVVEPQQHGARASYVVGEHVTLLDAVEERALFEEMRETSWELVGNLGKDRGVLLLVVSKSFEYEIKFDWTDLERWHMTKLDGGTGIPAGL